ncbi:MAG TPA: CPBP family intramembrane glutamic endopeptidase [Anaerolineales bacterium]|nr:CPBP family intramembrane glutamic endopeptidase [Anaerolineales bacterium]
MKKLFVEKLNLDWKIAVLTVVSTTLLVFDYYTSQAFPWAKWFPAWASTGLSAKLLDRTVFYFVIPMLIILLVFRQKPAEFGFCLGDWKAGLLLTIGSILLIAPILWWVARGNDAMNSFYKPMESGLPWNTLIDLFSWEFLFRGWLLFGYGRKFGPEAIWLQAVPFALAHVGKPELETLSTIIGGFLFGWVGWRTKSYLYPLLIHWFVASFVILVAAGALG